MAVAVAMVLGGSALPSAASAPFVKATYAWGHNVCGMGLYEFPFNYAQATPVAMAGLVNDVTQVSAGWGFNLVLRADGTVWAWGFNDSGQLGMGSSES
jgi:alpha-tubulin suppressor-like RCC1 family protein